MSAASTPAATGQSVSPKVAIFSPQPLLTVTVERRGTAGDDVHFHAGGQGVWVARMAGELGAEPVLCGFIGGEPGAVLEPLLGRGPGERHLIRTEAATGVLVFDRRAGDRIAIADSHPAPPSRHEVDDLFSATTAAAIGAGALVLCNPYPAEALPLEVFGALAADVGAQGVPVLADLSSPRLESALEGRPELVKLNNWELAEYVRGPVDSPQELRGAAERLIDAGAGSVIVTRGGEPALALRGGEATWVVPPRFERGAPQGCGDSMMGAIAAARVAGKAWEDSLVLGAAAGAANFLRHGLGSGDARTVEEIAAGVELRPF